MPSPVVLFAYNRPEALRRCLESLSADPLAPQTDLFIRIDGPKDGTDAVRVEQVRTVAGGAAGFRRVEVTCAEGNRGLGPSVIAGVDSVLERFDRVIVLEDDLTLVPSFLTFMNEALDRYRDEPAVFSVCGYTNRVRVPDGYGADAYFCPRSSSYGWGTWKDRWQSVDWNPLEASLRRNASAFNRWGGSDCAKLLRRWMQGRSSSWAIRFCYSEFLQGKVSLFPNLSLVDISGGFDGTGTNCRRYSRFKFSLDPDPQRRFRFPGRVEVLPSFRRSSLRYHSLAKRLWSRIRYMIDG